MSFIIVYKSVIDSSIPALYPVQTFSRFRRNLVKSGKPA